MSYNHYVFAKWTKGENVERSMKKPINKHNSQNEQQTNFSYEMDGFLGSAQHQTEMFDNTNNTDTSYGYSNGGFDDLGNGFTRQTTKRDSFNEMLSHRDLHTQVGQNPFLAGESYIQHLKVQEDYLRPQNTNVIEPKTNS